MAGAGYGAFPHSWTSGNTEDERDEKRPHGIYVGKVHDIGKRSSQQDSFGISECSQIDQKECLQLLRTAWEAWQTAERSARWLPCP